MSEKSKLNEVLYKNLVLNNSIVINYCKENNISIKRLSSLKADYLSNRIAFFLSPDERPLDGLTNDIATQPKAVLGVVISFDNNNIKVIGCESTKYTDLIKIN